MNINRWLLPLAVVALLGGCAATGGLKDKKPGKGTTPEGSPRPF